MSEDYTEGPASLWQAEIILASLAANEIDEGQVVLLAALYYHADWTTRVITDFRAERACEWLGREPAYARSMQRRLKTLRESGWFTWTYREGVKTPYDITLRAANMGCARHRHPVTPRSLSFSTLDDKFKPQVKTSTGESTPPTPPETVTVTPCPSPHDGGAHTASEVTAKLVYEISNGEELGRVLTPSQITALLDSHTVAEIVYAVERRVDKVRDRREFHRSFRSFLMGVGLQVELDATQDYWVEVNGRLVCETRAQGLERITKRIAAKIVSEL